MLDEAIKKEIQSIYSNFLANKALKPRYGQKLMIAEIARTLGAISLDAEGLRESDGHICVVEAGTGTGKTIAYLIAVLIVARALEKKVVLATATVALQEQVVSKDIPELIANTELDVNFSLAKGRGRYLCLSKLDKLLYNGDDNFIPLYEDEFSGIGEQDNDLYQSMMNNLSQGKWNGDRDEWPTEIEPVVWSRVTTDHRQCSGRKCSHVRNCAFFKAREALNDADCVVANHDLVLADIALGGGAILPAPEDSIYIFDEGHHLPDKAVNHFSHHVRYKSTIRWLGQTEGQWPNLVDTLQDAEHFIRISEPLESQLNATRKVMELGIVEIEKIVSTIDTSQQSPRLRFEQGVAPRSVEMLAEKCMEEFSELCQILEKMHNELNDLLESGFSHVPQVDIENMFALVGNWLTRANGALTLWMKYANTERQEGIPVARWITIVTYNDIVDYEIVACPILASSALEKDLWSRCCGAVVTSATLTALNSFERFKFHSGTYDNSCYSVVPSPFNFTEKAQLKIPAVAVEANDAALHTENIIDMFPSLCEEGLGVLTLFASRRQMMDVYDQLPLALQEKILVQGFDSKMALLHSHRQKIDLGEQSIIFGLASFAEGVDLPGQYCNHVIIAKIPFAVPDDPLEASLAEWIDMQGGNAFMQITVPDASVKLIQACGRLLRTETDTGVVTILDRRLLTKRYGKALLDALPPFKRIFNS